MAIGKSAKEGRLAIQSTALTRSQHELDPDLNIALWNGLFVHKDVPQDVRDKIVAVAKETVMSERAQKIAGETGALIYWQDAATAQSQIDNDIETLGRMADMLK